MINPNNLWQDIEHLRRETPLVHNITNFVVMNSTANILLAAGASPIMAHAMEEVDEVVAFSGALVINMGTLDQYWLPCMQRACRSARAQHKPVVFDPVGVGATTYRTVSALSILRESVTVVRGNASEIMVLADKICSTTSASAGRGVDSTASADLATNSAKILASHLQAVVVVSGKTDYIFSPSGEALRLNNGDEWMTRITGTGCGCSALVGAFCAIQKDAHRASAAAMALMGVAGEIAAESARADGKGVGSMAGLLLDALQNITEKTFLARLRLS